MEPLEFKSARLSLNISIKQLSKALGISTRTVFYWESGRSVPSYDAVEYLGLIEEVFEEYVDCLISKVKEHSLDKKREPFKIPVYETNESLWRDFPEFKPLPKDSALLAIYRVTRFCDSLTTPVILAIEKKP